MPEHRLLVGSHMAVRIQRRDQTKYDRAPGVQATKATLNVWEHFGSQMQVVIMNLPDKHRCAAADGVSGNVLQSDDVWATSNNLYPRCSCSKTYFFLSLLFQTSLPSCPMEHPAEPDLKQEHSLPRNDRELENHHDTQPKVSGTKWHICG